MDNLRLITWGLFAFLAFVTWQTWMEDYGPQSRPTPTASPTETTAEAPQPSDDGLDDLVVDDASVADPAGGEAGGDLPAIDPEIGAGGAGTDTATTGEAAVESQAILVETDVMRVRIDARGGTLSYAEMLDYPVEKDRPEDKVVLLDSGPGDVGAIRSWVRNRQAPDAAPGMGALYQVEATEYELGERDEVAVPLTWRSAAGVTVEKRFVFRRGEYAIRLEQRIRNDSGETWSGDPIAQIVRRSFEQERSMFDVDSYSFDGPQVYNGESADKLDRGDLIDDGPFEFRSDNGWVAAIQHHFLMAIVPPAGTTHMYQVRVDGDRMTASVIGAPATAAPGETATFERTLFVGPKRQDQLEALHEELPLTVDYGLLTPLAAPMFWLLSWVYGFVRNWGWSIIIVTVLIKLAFYRLTATSGRSMAKLRELQPRMKSLQDRYKDDRQALSQAMMELYKREKVNPAAGCLPILIQMPFFLAFYWVLVESVEMRQAPFALWITDLSSRDPYFILPLIMGAAMLFQQKLNPAPADPVQARVMQIMPIIFTVFFAFFPAGLVLYWVTNTLLSIAQQWRINKLVHAETMARKAGKPKKGRKNKSAGADTGADSNGD